MPTKHKKAIAKTYAIDTISRHELLLAIYAIANDYEASSVEDLVLRIRPELLWKCNFCNWVTQTENTTCDGCGKKRTYVYRH